jgi:hypothetical protein
MTAVLNNNDNNNNNNNNAARIGGRVLRFEFSGELVEHVTAFANLHQYDDRKTYKEAWTAWLAHDEIAALFKNDVARLSALGYKGNVADKLFKSGRYYFRGTTSAPRTPNDANGGGKDLKRRGSGAATALNQGSPRKYVLLNHQLLDAMDDHIDCGLRRDAHAYTPASGFAEFCKLNINSYSSEVTRLSEIMPTGEAVHDKLKKTYKNRYFMMTKPGRRSH